jgi:hypothetical protein
VYASSQASPLEKAGVKSIWHTDRKGRAEAVIAVTSPFLCEIIRRAVQIRTARRPT